MADPDRIELALLGVFIGALVEIRRVATLSFALSLRRDGSGDKIFKAGEDFADGARSNGAGHMR